MESPSHNSLSLVSLRVAVTGSTGFIGMHLLRGLHAAGAEIVAIAAASKHVERLDRLPFPVERIIVEDMSDIDNAIRQAKAEYVIHLSAFISTDHTLDALEQTVRQNLLPTVSLLAAAAEERLPVSSSWAPAKSTVRKRLPLIRP